MYEMLQFYRRNYVVLSVSIYIANVLSMSLKTCFVGGYDELQAHILKQNIVLYIKPLTHLVNTSIIKGIFPDELKIAKVIPIFKSGNKDLIENYRPISILSVFTKVFEKVMYKHL